ncbi:gluconate:H+ symporter [Weissella paramesenteroides]|jgi:GntP family gluconate:H+ symporter|uniref:gluconate:H+ symporter n=1 Tax=Weissella paramesenteroides TaxID=1249 RepID=UPI00123AD415|nr:gluconate:H+ symporter [Weissella paramesenteroides]KAA8456422.1 gluconate permease [Weissella paramesenteroides]KAA8456634.1 gluconate permease [Weissella paramesenteroides]KAA8459044.1 gluconate permease [Weissella paramesenteroides]KAA8463450.1 gluconate permease [Weissella paramesenteroides]KAA8465501.1 gluconate permease [Weissella paramesenteroides]
MFTMLTGLSIDKSTGLYQWLLNDFNVWPFLILVLGIALLLFFILKLNVNTFVALIITSILVALGLGMNPAGIAGALKDGIGGTMGELIIVFGFGSMIGRLVSDSGGSYRIATTLINKFGKKRLQWAVAGASFIIGISLLFEVGLVVLIPIVFTIALEAEVPLLYLGIPMAAALSAAQGFLPPQPSPTAVTNILGANIGIVLMYGIIVAIIAMIVAGPLFTRVIKKVEPKAFKITKKLDAIGEVKTFKLEDTPSFGLAIFTSLMPVIFMLISTIYTLSVNAGKQVYSGTVGDAAWKAMSHAAQKGYITDPSVLDKIIAMLGNPVIAMVIAMAFAIWSMGPKQNRTMAEVGDSMSNALKSIANLLMVIGGGAAFKGILTAGGISDAIAAAFSHTSLSPIIFAWIIALILRVSVGSATVAGLTTAGIVAPLVASQTAVNPAFVVLAIGAGSLGVSHVNDAGFWMFKEFFDLDVPQTLKIWTVLETLISVVGLIVILILSALFS